MNLRKRGSTVIVQRASTNSSVVGISIWRTDKQTEKSIFSSMFYSRRGLRSRRCISGTNGPQIHESLSYPDLARCNVGGLRGIEKKVHHAQCMHDSTRPGGSFASYPRRRAFATQGRGEFTAELPILVIQVGLTESVCELGGLIETPLHVFWDVL